MELPETRIPSWMKVKIPAAGPMRRVESILRRLALNTVCESALCPNRGECFEHGTATFMILGPVCTRNCAFCAVAKGRPDAVDKAEPLRVAEAVKQLGLRHVVITSVDRDDLEDKGAGHFAATVRAIHQTSPGVTIELLVPDFCGIKEAADIVLDVEPAILNHNVETVPRLHPKIKPKSDYKRSLWLLRYAKEQKPRMLTKSGIMVGLGETLEEVVEVMKDLRSCECDILTIGQYLKPPGSRLGVQRYVKPEEFMWLREVAERMGFSFVASAPLMRSSYNAAEVFRRLGV